MKSHKSKNYFSALLDAKINGDFELLENIGKEIETIRATLADLTEFMEHPVYPWNDSLVVESWRTVVPGYNKQILSAKTDLERARDTYLKAISKYADTLNSIETTRAEYSEFLSNSLGYYERSELLSHADVGNYKEYTDMERAYPGSNCFQVLADVLNGRCYCP